MSYKNFNINGGKIEYMENVRDSIRNVVLLVTSVIALALVLRVIFDMAELQPTSSIISVIHSVSDFLIAPFKDIVRINNPTFATLNTDAFFALGVYIVGASLVGKVITGFLYDNLHDIVQNFVDGLFKIVEVIITLRILFEIFAILPAFRQSAFVDSIFSWSEWTQTLLFKLPLGEGYINLSAIVWLAIIILLDVISERYLEKLLGGAVVVTVATTKVIKAPRFRLFRRSSSDSISVRIDNPSSEDKPKEVYIDVPPPKA
ncbi:MAG: hypothetical protein IAE65_08915 [Ignavibacteria bacterium]|nr:hypothetical protein [Ignavibacteria bacterium]